MSAAGEDAKSLAPVVAEVGPSDGDSASANRSYLWIAVAILAIAVAGALGGVAVDRAMHARGFGGPGGRGGRFGGMGGMGMGGPMGHAPSDSLRKGMRERTAKELDLTPAQSAAVDTLMSVQGPKFRALREQFEPRMDSLVTETRAGMDRILTPAQREKSKAMRERMRSRGAGRHGPPG